MIPILLNYWDGAPPLLGYITTRAVFGFLTAFFVGLVIGRPLILWLYRSGYRSPERSYGDISTASKKSTPVMGGLIIAACGIGSVLIWADVGNPRVLMVVAASLWFASMGAMDDVGKVRGKDADAGISRLAKYASQIGFGGLLGGMVIWQGTRLFGPDEVMRIYIPFMKSPLIDLAQIFGTSGWGWAVACVVFGGFAAFVITYTTNAVNFTDGLDGLLVVPAALTLVVLGIFAYLLGNSNYAGFLLYVFQPGSGELAVVCGTMVGACLAFLWYNAHPAEVFMGDTGSMMLGGLIGSLALLLKQEALLVLVGAVFFAEVLSTFIQERFGLKFGKRIMSRAPIHHVFQHQGMPETRIVTRFWIVSTIFAALALATLKIR
jgi:phospho-N-acetylmuramoyl-pentapeptide-transferase